MIKHIYRYRRTDLGATLLVGVLVLDSVDLEAVALQGAPLGEALLAEVALVGPDPGVGPGVPFQIEGVVEALSAEGAQVSFDVAVALHVTVQKSLEAELLAAHAAGELVWVLFVLLRISKNYLLAFIPIIIVFKWTYLGGCRSGHRGRALSRGSLLVARCWLSLALDGQGILYAVSAVHELQLTVARKSQL